MERKYIFDIFKKYNGVMKATELNKEKISYPEIYSYLQKGVIEKIKYGYYRINDSSSFSDIFMINRFFSDAVFCSYYALFYYGYSDRTPSQYDIAVIKNASRTKYKINDINIKTHYIEKKRLNIGVTTKNINGANIKIYDKERVICDCFRYMNSMDREVFNNAIQRYINDDDKNIPNLIKYAKELGVYNKMKDIIGIWL